MLALGISNPLKFDYIDPPDPMTLARALTILDNLEAIKKGEITKLGRNMAKFPLDPKLSRALLKADKYHVVPELLSIACMLEVRDR